MHKNTPPWATARSGVSVRGRIYLGAWIARSGETMRQHQAVPGTNPTIDTQYGVSQYAVMNSSFEEYPLIRMRYSRFETEGSWFRSAKRCAHSCVHGSSNNTGISTRRELRASACCT